MYEKHKSECRAMNKLIHIYQHSGYDNELYSRMDFHMDKMQRKVFNSIKSKLKLEDKQLYYSQLYDPSVLTVPLVECIRAWDYHNNGNFYLYFWTASLHYVYKQLNKNKLPIDNYVRTDTVEHEIKLHKSTVTIHDDLTNVEEILKNMDLNKNEKNLVKILMDNHENLTDKQLAEKHNISKRTFERIRKNLKVKKNLYFFKKSGGFFEKATAIDMR